MCLPHCPNVDSHTLPNGTKVCRKHYEEHMWFKTQTNPGEDMGDVDYDCDRCGKEMEFTGMIDIHGNKTHLQCPGCGNKKKIR